MYMYMYMKKLTKGRGIALGNTKFLNTHHMTFLTTFLYMWHPHILLEMSSVTYRSWSLCSWFHSHL